MTNHWNTIRKTISWDTTSHQLNGSVSAVFFLELSPHACIHAQSCTALCNPMTTVHQAPLSMEFSRHKYWSRLPFPIPGDLLKPGMESTSLASPALAGGCLTTGGSWELHQSNGHHQKVYKWQMLGRVWRKGKLPTCRWGCKLGR